MKGSFQRRKPDQDASLLKVHKMHGCVPAFGLPATDYLCVLDWHSPVPGAEEAREIPVPFRFRNGSWSILENVDGLPSPACPSLQEAQRLLRAFKKNDSLQVTGEVDEGEGSFTTDRGMMRNQSGPLRIMCRYEVKSRSGNLLAISYLWYEDGKYRLDEVEDWYD